MAIKANWFPSVGSTADEAAGPLPSKLVVCEATTPFVAAAGVPLPSLTRKFAVVCFVSSSPRLCPVNAETVQPLKLPASNPPLINSGEALAGFAAVTSIPKAAMNLRGPLRVAGDNMVRVVKRIMSPCISMVCAVAAYFAPKALRLFHRLSSKNNAEN